MITESEIKSKVYGFVSQSSLASLVNGVVTKRVRPLNSTKEDIVISVLASNAAQIQQFFVNVNIYVPYNEANNEEDSHRVQTLSIQALNLFESFRIDGLKCDIDAQSVIDLPNIGQSVINNKILIKQANS